MREFRRKEKIRRVVYSMPSLLFLLLVTVFLVKGAIGVVIKERKSSAQVADLAQTLAVQAEREGILRENIAHLKTEKGIKDEIRDRFSVAEEGEYVAIIVDERRSATSTLDSGQPWYKRFWYAIIPSND
jgi:cell division protein FtsB